MKKKIFQGGMKQLALSFNTEVNETRTQLYWENLKDLKNEDFEKAVKFIIQNNKFFPAIAEIRQVTRNSDQDVLEAWNEFRDEIREHGVYSLPQFKKPILHQVVRFLGGWQTVSYVERKDMPFLRRDFIEIYKVLRQREEIDKIQLPEPAEKKKIMLDIIKEKEGNDG